MSGGDTPGPKKSKSGRVSAYRGQARQNRYSRARGNFMKNRVVILPDKRYAFYVNESPNVSLFDFYK